MADDAGKRLSLLARLGKFLARLVNAIGPDDPSGNGVIPGPRFAIDDGVDYSLPLVVPEWVSDDQRAALIQAYVAEASATFHFQFDRPYRYSENLSQFPTVDPLREWDFATRKEILSRCHMAWERNPLANTAIGLTTLFTVGDGFNVSYRNQDVREVLEAFRDNAENAVEQYEKSFCSDLQLDGELFIRLQSDDSGQTVIVPLPPWEIIWIQTELGFHRRVVSYHQQGTQSDGSPGSAEAVDLDIAAGEMLHIAINQCSYETRGRPELFRILPWLKAYKDWLENRARQNHWRGLLYDVTVKGGTPTSVAAKRAQYKQPPSPGSITIHNDSEIWQVMEAKVGAADVKDDGREIKLMTVVGARLPEYFLADGSNANLATTKSQQLPALRKFTDFQDILIGQVWKPIYRRVVQNAVDAGLLPEYVEEQDADGEPLYEPLDVDALPEPTLAPAPVPANTRATAGAGGNGAKPAPAPAPVLVPPPMPNPNSARARRKKTAKIRAVDAFDVTAPEIEQDDPKTLAEALQIAVSNEWASGETASSRMGFDPGIEKKKIDAEAAENMGKFWKGQGGQPPLPGAAPTLADYQPAKQPEPEQESEIVTTELVAAPTPGPLVVNLFGGVNGNGQATDEYGLAGEVSRFIQERIGQATQDAQEKALGQVAELGAQVGKVQETTDTLARRLDSLAQDADRRDAGYRDALGQMVEAMEGFSEQSAPPIIALDEQTVARIARVVATEAAQAVVAGSEKVRTEILTRDEQDRAATLRVMFASGRTADYRVVRDTSGHMVGLERIGE